MNKIEKTILLFSKIDWWSNKVYNYLVKHFQRVYRFRGDWGHPIPKKQIENIGEVDYIISYLCPWILPKWILDKAKEHAINFHPAPPKYPGIGGYNYAIWNGDEDYGVMVHEMAALVDSGKIYNVVYFNIQHECSVENLKEDSMCMMFGLFQDTMLDIIDSGRIYQTVQDEDTKWHTPPYTRKGFQKNCEISTTHWADWITEHIANKVRAFYFPGARDYPYFKINGKKYKVILVEDES